MKLMRLMLLVVLFAFTILFDVAAMRSDDEMHNISSSAGLAETVITWNSLPREIKELIISFLQVKDLEQTRKYFKNMALVNHEARRLTYYLFNKIIKVKEDLIKEIRSSTLSKVDKEELFALAVNRSAKIADIIELFEGAENKKYWFICKLLLINWEFYSKDFDFALNKSYSFDPSFIELFLNKGANANARDKFGFSLLAKSYIAGDILKINLLIEAGADINFKDEKGESITKKVIGQAKLVKLMRLLQAEIFITRENPLVIDEILARIVTEDKDIANLLTLLQSNIDESLDEKHKTALMIASTCGCTKLVELLVDKSSNINRQNEDGLIALMFAAYNGRDDIVKFLLSKKADQTLVNFNGYTALDLAQEKGNYSIAELLEEQKQKCLIA